MKHIFDVIVIGGGINGAGIAADAAGRGLKIGIYDAADFASATSSASSKLIHGGLRYLEHKEFRLVGEALAEREVVLNKAPHLVTPMRFRLPHRPFLRPAWMIRIGMFLYDYLAKRSTLPASKKVDLTQDGLMKPELKVGFEYSDCWADDARLVVANIKDAQRNGAEVRNYTSVERAERVDGLWVVTLRDQFTGQQYIRYSKALVNAAGPWVKDIFTQQLDLPSPRGIRLIQGSHIVVPQIHQQPESYILQNEDGRIVFVIPYLDRFSLIGTTDLEYQGDPRKVEITQEEQDYLIDVVNKHFKHTITTDDIVWSYAGVRPLCDDESDSPQAVTRDYTMEVQDADGKAPLLSIFGGKLTTYRKLAEAAMTKLQPWFPHMGDAWTATKPLPGGELSLSLAEFAEQLQRNVPELDAATAQRLSRQFGSQSEAVLRGANGSGLGKEVVPGVFQAEIEYLMQHEYVKTIEDLLWRRTKLGLLLSQEEQDIVTAYFNQLNQAA